MSDAALRALLTSDAVELRIIAWPDPVLAETGHDALSPYVEAFWLPVLGPTTTWLLRRIELARRREIDVFNLTDLAHELGISGLGYGGWGGALARSFRRLTHFSIAAALAEGLAVHTHVPHLRPVQVANLPQSLQKVHPPLARIKARSA